MARRVALYYSPDEGIWYYQQMFGDWKVSKKHYQSKAQALTDYYWTDDPSYEWE
jgi:hypothetical protein